MSKPILVVIVGPTAVGKTSLSIELARKFETEIVSADSRQFYREMQIGTAKPTAIELDAAPHHLVNNLSVRDDYSVGHFEQDALRSISTIFSKKEIAIMVGGSGMYVDAVCNGLDDFPEIDPKYRENIKKEFEKKGISFLQEEVEKEDPEYFNIVDRQNPQRLMRALEVIYATGRTFSSFRVKKTVDRPFQVLKIGLEMERPLVYERIDQRMDLMIEEGLFEEAKRLYPLKHLNALQTVGYQEIFGFLDGHYDKEEAIRLLKRNSRRYAKRQLTWFKRDENTHWFAPSQLAEIKKLIEQKLESFKAEN